MLALHLLQLPYSLRRVYTGCIQTGALQDTVTVQYTSAEFRQTNAAYILGHCGTPFFGQKAVFWIPLTTCRRGFDHKWTGEGPPTGCDRHCLILLQSLGENLEAQWLGESVRSRAPSRYRLCCFWQLLTVQRPTQSVTSRHLPLHNPHNSFDTVQHTATVAALIVTKQISVPIN